MRAAIASCPACSDRQRVVTVHNVPLVFVQAALGIEVAALRKYVFLALFSVAALGAEVVNPVTVSLAPTTLRGAIVAICVAVPRPLRAGRVAPIAGVATGHGAQAKEGHAWAGVVVHSAVHRAAAAPVRGRRTNEAHISKAVRAAGV